jgi:acyl-CoA synthetase (AMP-forming)/AMP-acid ligase II
VGAGVLTNEVAAKTLAAFPRASIASTYGMTELGLVASRSWTESPIVESTFDRLVPDLALEVMDADEGAEGEIQIWHPLLFLGYFDVAARAFARREGPYRTGDLGVLEGLILTLRSRKKAVAKVAGVLISLDEISALASRLEGVADCGTIAVPDPVFGEAIHVFLAPVPGRGVDPREVATRILAATLLRTSPRVHVIDRLPRSDSGKLARGTLEVMAREADRVRV